MGEVADAVHRQVTMLRDIRQQVEDPAVTETLLLEHAHVIETTITAPPAGSIAFRPEPRQCYLNAWRIATSGRLLYTEGFAATTVPLAIAHAWLTDPETGQVYDPTWVTGGPGVYFGIPFSYHYVQEHTRKHKQPCILHNHHLDPVPFTVIDGIVHPA